MKELLVKSKDAEVQKEAKTMGYKIIDKVEPVVEVVTKKDEEKAVQLSAKNKVLYLKCKDWKIIPLENLIAKNKGAKLIAIVSSSEEAKLALETMEIGADGVVLETEEIKELQKTMKLIEQYVDVESVSLEEAKVTQIKALGKGDRSCIDTCVKMKKGEGMLVGSSSQGMIFVQAEVEENELAAPRPFRVNAGALSLYIMAPENKTKYIEEINAGDEVLIVDRNGKTKKVNVARSKIEVRPMVLVEVKTKDGKKAVAILQNAETIRLVTEEGSIPVTELKTGNTILAYFSKGGRHFGTLVEKETITEK